MTRFSNLVPKMDEFAEDIGWHLLGFVQGLFDMATVTAIALTIYASDVGVPPIIPAQASAAMQGPAVCVVNCISASVLKRQNS